MSSADARGGGNVDTRIAPLMARLEERIRSYGAARALVAFSGGVDSATVVALAARALGPELVTAVTAVSPSYPEGELEEARGVAASLGVPHVVMDTREVEREAYARNDGRRCFHCKTELYATIRRLAASEQAEDAVTMSGANADDPGEFRPGLRAAEEQRVRSPLLEEGVRKAVVRDLARALGLSVAEKPALACLSSRVAFGIRITPELLGRIDRAERLTRALGFDVVRVRHLGETASIEVRPGEVNRLMAHHALPALRRQLRDMGWSRIVVDLQGYRPGSLNVTRVSPLGPSSPGLRV